MKLSKMCFREYLKSPREGLRFVFVDPPWNYGMQGSKLQDATAGATAYEYWGTDNSSEVASVLRSLPSSVDGVFIWTTNPMLEATLRAVFDSSVFRFRSLLTWEKTTVNDKQASVMAHYFLNCTEFLVFVVRKKLNDKINRVGIPTHFSAVRGNRTVKPHDIEVQIVNKLGGKWAYLFSGMDVEAFNGMDIDLVDTCLTNLR